MQDRLSELLRRTVCETLNAKLEADAVWDRRRYEGASDDINPRAGHHDREFHAKTCEVRSSLY